MPRLGSRVLLGLTCCTLSSAFAQPRATGVDDEVILQVPAKVSLSIDNAPATLRGPTAVKLARGTHLLRAAHPTPEVDELYTWLALDQASSTYAPPRRLPKHPVSSSFDVLSVCSGACFQSNPLQSPARPSEVHGTVRHADGSPAVGAAVVLLCNLPSPLGRPHWVDDEGCMGTSTSYWAQGVSDCIVALSRTNARGEFEFKGLQKSVGTVEAHEGPRTAALGYQADRPTELVLPAD